MESNILLPNSTTRTMHSTLNNALFSNGLNNATAFIANLEAAYHDHILHQGLAVTHHLTGRQMEYKDLKTPITVILGSSPRQMKLDA